MFSFINQLETLKINSKSSNKTNSNIDETTILSKNQKNSFEKKNPLFSYSNNFFSSINFESLKKKENIVEI
jgi:hypothetical protein